MLMFELWRRMCRIHHFCEYEYRAKEDGRIGGYIYLPSGQESIASAVAAAFVDAGIRPSVFMQHRNQDKLCAFGADMTKVRDELLGRETGTTRGVGGDPMHDAQDAEWGKIFGHDGFVGSHVPIAVGYAYATQEWTACFMGDGTVEEDCWAPSIGFAADQRLPILFVVEDNDLSVITTKEKRRSWDVANVAKGYGMDAMHLSDDPFEIYSFVKGLLASKRPALINVSVQRKYFHVGAGQDSEMKYDRMQLTREALSLIDPVKTKQIEDEARKEMEELWTQHL
jgi:acetoin:2,6-dichlorophenolindophenol oxidoreductase subunit alpha